MSVRQSHVPPPWEPPTYRPVGGAAGLPVVAVPPGPRPRGGRRGTAPRLWGPRVADGVQDVLRKRRRGGRRGGRTAATHALQCEEMLGDSAEHISKEAAGP
eukprot:Skav200268  [mRNA]  locus=scaffold93:31163:33176:- [translate_table: standard]